MSIGIQNFDSSFFKVDTPAIDKISESDIISFSLTEEMGKINNGSISFLDQDDVYSRMLRVGAPVEISWGYLKPDLGITSLFGTKENAFELIGGYSRTGFNGTVQSPSGGGSSGGTKTFNMGFYGSEYAKRGDHKTFKIGTKGDVIRKVLLDMGILTSEIKFDRMIEVINPDTYVYQRESNFKFLLRMAREWHAIFRVGYDSSGNMTAIFISSKYIDTSLFPLASTSALAGSSVMLSYMDKPNNVIEYSWQNHAGDSGSGDNMRINIVNGKVVIQRFVTKNDTVTVWKLDMNKLKKVMKKKQVQGGNLAVVDFVKKWTATNDWDQIKRFFIRSKETTAPQGIGYSVNVKMIGNPLMTAGGKVVFGNGFPDLFSNKMVSFYCKKVTHKIDRTGYFMDLECVDTYTALGGSMI